MYGYGKKKSGGMKKTGMKKMAGGTKSRAKTVRKPAKKTTSRSRKK